jgi:hypothetical protein
MLTSEQKKTVADWMGWIWFGDYFITKDISRFLNRRTHFSLNDAALCVEKMERRKRCLDFEEKTYAIYAESAKVFNKDFIAWLMTVESDEAVNFFTAMAVWIEEEK